ETSFLPLKPGQHITAAEPRTGCDGVMNPSSSASGGCRADQGRLLGYQDAHDSYPPLRQPAAEIGTRKPAFHLKHRLFVESRVPEVQLGGWPPAERRGVAQGSPLQRGPSGLPRAVGGRLVAHQAVSADGGCPRAAQSAMAASISAVR